MTCKISPLLAHCVLSLSSLLLPPRTTSTAALSGGPKSLKRTRQVGGEIDPAEKLNDSKIAKVTKHESQQHLEQKDVKCIRREMFPLKKKKKDERKRGKKGSSRVIALLTQDAVTPYGGMERQIPADVEME